MSSEAMSAEAPVLEVREEIDPPLVCATVVELLGEAQAGAAEIVVLIGTGTASGGLAALVGLSAVMGQGGRRWWETLREVNHEKEREK